MSANDLPDRIVAEVTRNWRLEDHDPSDTISAHFEHVIAFNDSRGYELESWQFQTSLVSHPSRYDVLIETIIAVFKRREL